MRLALFTLAKDEAHQLPELVGGLRPWVDEVVILADVDSVDRTVEVAEALADRCYRVRFADDFGALLTMGLHLCAPNDYALWLDGDERMDGVLVPVLRALAQAAGDPGSALAIQRRRWLDRERTQEVVEAGPDWQPRFLPVSPAVRFTRRVHPQLVGVDVFRVQAARRICIDHFHDLKSPTVLAQRNALYVRLAALDGIAVEGGQPLDQLCGACAHRRDGHAGARSYAKPPFACLDCDDCEGFW